MKLRSKNIYQKTTATTKEKGGQNRIIKPIVSLFFCVGFLFFCGFGNSSFATTTNWYLKTTGTNNINVLTNWTQDPTGTTAVGSLASFANPGAGNTTNFYVQNIANPTLSAALTIGSIGAGTVTLNLGNGTNAVNLTIPSGFALTNTTAAINVAANATLTITNATIPTLGTLNAASTVVYNAAAAQAITATTYGNLTYSGTNTGSLSGATTIAGTFILSSGTVSAGANNIIVSSTGSTVWQNNGGTFTAGTGTVTFTGAAPTIGGTVNSNFNNLTLNNSSGASLSAGCTIAGTLTLSSGTFSAGSNNIALTGTGASVWLNNATYSAGTSTVSFTGTNPTIGGTSANSFYILTLNNSTGSNLGSSCTVNNTLNINGGTFTIGGYTMTMPLGSTLNLNSGAITNTASNLLVSGAVVRDNASLSVTPTTTYALTSLTYANLGTNTAAVTTGNEWPASLTAPVTINKTGATITLNANKTSSVSSLTITAGTLSTSGFALPISGNMLNNGVLTAGASTITVGGNWTNNLTFTPGTSTVSMTGSAPTIGGSVANSFANLTLNNATGATLGSNCTVTGTLNYNNGTLNYSTYSLTLSGASTLNLNSGSINNTSSNLSVSGAVVVDGATFAVTPTTYSPTSLTYANLGTNASTVTTGTEWPIGLATGVTINKSGATITLNANKTTAIASLTITSGTLSTAGYSLSVTGTMTNNGTLSAGASTISEAGNWTNNATFSAGTSTVSFTGATPTIGGTAANTFNIVNIGNGGSLGSNCTVNNILNINGGTLTIGGNTLTMPIGSTLNLNAGAITNTATNLLVSGAVVRDNATLAASPTGTYSLTSLTYANLGTNTAAVTVGNEWPAALATAITVNKSGATITLNAAKTATTSVNVSSGTLSLSTFGLTTTGAVTVNTGATLTTNSGGLTVGGAVNNSGTLSCTGTGAISIAGVLTNTGTISESSNGAITMSGTGSVWLNNGGTFTAGTGTVSFTGAAPTIGGTTATTFYNLTLNNSTGTTLGIGCTVSKVLTITSGTFSAGSNNITMTGGGAGTWTNNATFSAGTGTVSFTGATPVIGGTSANTFNVLSIANGGSLGSNCTVTNTLNINGGTFTIGGSTLTLTGTSTLNLNSGSISNTATNLLVSGAVVRDNGTLAVTPTSTYSLTSLSYANLGTNTTTVTVGLEWPAALSTAINVNKSGATITLNNAKTGVTTLNVAAGTLSASTFGITTSGTVSVSSGAVLTTNTGSLTFNGAVNNAGTLSSTGISAKSIAGVLTNTGTISEASTGTLIMSGTGSIWLNNGGTFSPGTGTVTFTGIAPVIGGTSPNSFYNLTLNNSTGSTLGANCTISNKLTLSFGSFNAGSYTLIMSGTGNVWANNAVFAPATSTVSFTGAAPSIGGTSANTFYNLSLNNSTGATIATNCSVNNVLTLTSGLLSIGTNNLTMGAGATFSGTPSNSNMIIATGSGVVQQMLSGPGSFTFPVGDAVGPNYTPITINFTAGTYSSAYASVNLTKAKQPNNANISNYLNRYWNINTSGITSPSYSVSATYVPADVVGVETNIMAGFYPNASPWQSGSATNVLTHTLTTNSITNAAGSVTGLNTSAPVFSLSPADTVICFPAVSNLTITTTGVTADPTVSYSWSTSSGTLSTLTGVSSILTPGDSGVTTVTVTLTDGNGFTSTATSVITVNATPNVVVTPNSGCAAQVMFATGANTYSWTPNIALSDTTSDTVLANPTNDVVYTVTGTSVSGCVAQATANVGASPGIISGTFVLCQSSTVTMSNSVSGGTWSVSDSTATVDSVLGIVTGVSGGNPVVSYTAGSCYAVFAPMTINPQPTGVSASVFPTFTCTTDSITLIGYATGASTYSWNGPGGSAIASPSSLNTGTANVTTSNAGVYTLTATTNFGCAVTVTSSPVSINPTPAPIAGGATSVCIASSTPAFTDASGGGTWSSASPSIATVAGTGIVTGVLGGSATISYTVAGCPVTTNIAVANFSGTLPWSEGFEGVTTANVLNQCNELLGELPVKAEPNGEWSVGTAAQVEANAGTTPPFGTDPHPAITPHSGSELVGFGFEGASAYFWTPGFTVTAGNTYEFSYYYVTDGHGNNGGSGVPAGDPGDYNAYMYFNTSQTLVGATAFQSYSVAVTPGNTAALSKAPVMLNLNGTTYQQWTGYFTPETSGTYFFCINAQDQNLYATYYWAVDDISFSVASNCLAPAAPTANTCSPSSGSSTSMTVTAASADSFLTIAMLAPSSPSSGPVAGTNYALGASLGGGTVIAKGLPGVSTAIASGFLPGASSFQLYTYAFKHDSCNGVAYSSAAAAVATFTTCPTTPPAAPVIAAMMPGGTNAVTLSGLPTDVGSVVTVYAWTNATGTTPASPASYSVSSLSATYTVPTSLTSGTNLWFTVQESLGGCSVTSAVSAQASIPFPLPWSESFESGSVLNNRSPNFMLGNAPIYISQTPKFYGGEDNQSLISPHGGSWDYLFFGGAISSSTDVPYTSITAYTNQWLVTPGLYCPNAGTYVLSFYYYDYSTAFPALKIQYSTIPGLPSNGSSTMTSGTAVATISSPTLNGWTLYSVPITISSGPQTIFVGLDVTINSTFNYAAIDDIEFCEKPTAIVTNSTSSTPVCTSGSITMTATTTPVASLTSGSWNYTWSGPGTVTSTTNTATGSSLGSLDYYPIYSLTVTNSNDIGNQCTSSAITTTATITPTPAAITGAATLCGGATSLYSGGAIIGSPGWGISGSGSSYATGTVTSGLNVSTTNPASQQTISVNYTNACGSQTKTVTINVQPVAITGGATSICTNNATATPFTDATGGGTWSTNVTTYGTISSGGTFSSSSSVGTEIISYTESTGGCFSTTTIDVGNSGPSGGFGGAPYSVCVGGTVTIGSPTPTGGFWSTSNSAVATVSSSGVVTGVANGVANISYSSGCASAVFTPVTVNGTSGSVSNSTPVCTGSNITLNGSGVTPGSGTTYSWSGPVAITGATLVNATVSGAAMTANGVYTLTTLNNGCSNQYTTLATVSQAPPVPTLSGSPASPICSGTSTTLSSTFANETPRAFLIPVYTPTFTVTGNLSSATVWTGGSSSDGYYSVSLPFSFNFFGSSYTTLNISTNGYINFGTGSVTAAANTIPSATGPTNEIELFQHAMTLASSGNIQYGVAGSAPNRQFVVYYNAVPDASGSNSGYLVLNETTGVIDAIVLSHSGTAGAATCGIENNLGTLGVAATGRNNATYTISTAEAWRFYGLNNYNYTWAPSGSLVSSTVSNPATNALSTATTFSLTASDAINSTCSVTATYTVNLNTSASLSLSNVQACIGATSVYLPFTGVVGSPTSYSISWNSAAIAAGFSNTGTLTFPGGTSGSLPISLSGTTVSAGTVYYGVLTISNSLGCSNNYSFTITIEAQPSLNLATVTINSPTSTTMCAGQVLNLTVSGATGGASPYIYTWVGPGISGSVTSTSNTLIYTSTSASTVSGTYSVSLASGSTGCATTGYKGNATVYTVNPAPTLTSITNSASTSAACIGSSYSLFANGGTNITSYSWSGANISSGALTSAATVSSAATLGSDVYTVSVTNGTGSGCTNNYTTTVIVRQVPTLTNATNNATSGTACTGASFRLTANGSSNVTGYSWAGANITSGALTSAASVTSVSALGADIYTVTVSNGTGTGCSARYTTTVNVNPAPSLTNASNSTTGSAACTGATFSLFANGASNVAGYSWTGANISSGATTSAATVSSASVIGADAYVVTVSNGAGTGCSVNYATTVNVTASPTLTSVTNTAATGAACSGASYILDANGAAHVTGYSWAGANISGGALTSAATVSSVSTLGADVYTVTVVNGSGTGCAAKYTTTVNVSPVPTLTSASNNAIGGSACVGGSFSLFANGASNITGYSWSGANISAGALTSAASVTSVVPTGADVYTVTVNNGTGTGCTASYATTVNVGVPPSLTSASNSTSGNNACVGASFNLLANGALNVTGYTWSGANITGGATTSLASVSPAILGTDIYTVTVNNGSGSGCTVHYTTAITVNPVPTLTSATNSGIVCSGHSVVLTANGASNVTGYLWAGPDAISSATSATASVTSASTLGSDTYSVTVNNGSGTGCTASYTTVVTVNPLPSLTGATNSGSACPGGLVTLFANGPANVTGYSWSGPDAISTSTSSTATVSSVSTLGTDTYTVTVNNGAGAGCTVNYTTVVTVNPLPALTSVSNSSPVCLGTGFSLTASGPSNVTGYTWSGADAITGSTSATASVTSAATLGSDIYTVTVSNGSGAGCTANYVTTVNVNPMPSLTGVINSGTLCSGGSITLQALGAANVTGYSWTGPDLITDATSVTATVPSATTLGADVYTVTVVNGTGGGCVATYTTSVTVEAQPTLGTVSASMTALCAGTALTLSETGSSAPSTGSNIYTWSGPTGVITTLSSLTGVVFTPTTTAYSGVYTLTASYVENGCSSPSVVSPTITVYPQANGTLSLTYPTYICPGIVEGLSASISGGIGTPTYYWSGPGIVGSVSTGATSSYTVIPTSTGVYTLAVTYSVTGCNTDTLTSTTVIPATQMWIGVTNSDWNTASNWSCGTVPTVTDSVLIPNGATYSASILTSGTGTCKKLKIGRYGNLTLSSGANLNIYGDLLDTGTIAGTGTLNLVGSSGQRIFGNGSVSNIVLNNNSGATINSIADSLTVTGRLALNAGTFTTNNSLILSMSDDPIAVPANGRIDSIAAGGGSISGKVIIQQYIKGGRRAYRFWGTPFVDSIPLSQYENYIDVTGSYGSGHGFTPTSSNAASAFWYHTSNGNSGATGSSGDPGWKPFTWCVDSMSGAVHVSADSNMVHRFQGFRLFFRGAKGEGLDASPYIVDPVTVRQWGTVNTGTVDVSLQKGTLVSGTGAPLQDYNMRANPYPSAVDLGAVVYNAFQASMLFQPSIYVWNAYAATAGAFVTIDETSYTPYYISANTSYQVRAAYNGALLHFTESNKVVSPSSVLLKSKPDEIELNVYDESYHIWDMMKLKFTNEATENEDRQLDAGKPVNPDLNFYSWSADRHPLSIDARPFEAGKVIPLGLTSNYRQNFIIKVDNFENPVDGQIYLHDKFLEQYMLLSQGAEYHFEVTNEPGSQGDNRFELGLQPQNGNVQNKSSNIKVLMIPNPASSIVNITFSAPQSAYSSVRIVTLEGVVELSKDLGMTQDGSVSISLENLASGVYLVEFISGSEKVTERLIKE